MAAADVLLSRAIDGLEPLMQGADECRRKNPRHPKRAVERDLKDGLRSIAADVAPQAGLELEDVERKIAPLEWPRGGPVDLVFAYGAQIDSGVR